MCFKEEKLDFHRCARSMVQANEESHHIGYLKVTLHDTMDLAMESWTTGSLSLSLSLSLHLLISR
jgi:hypothetical protein